MLVTLNSTPVQQQLEKFLYNIDMIICFESMLWDSAQGWYHGMRGWSSFMALLILCSMCTVQLMPGYLLYRVTIVLLAKV